MSGIDVEGSSIRKGAVDAVLTTSDCQRQRRSGDRAAAVGLRETWRKPDRRSERIAKPGGTPLAVAKDGKLLGVIHLKDIVKGGIRERFADAAPDGHPHRDDHRRQSADRRGDRRRSRASTISSPRRRRRTSSS